MSLPEHVAKAFMEMSYKAPDECKVIWTYFKKQADEMVEAVLTPDTAPAERELLVLTHEIYRQEVVNLPQTAMNQMNKPESGS